ncbi:MAG: histidine phosphatase family protein [Alphaproteobacteria bacterium]|nr:histidine phosphatase family protein [Alphaproteobacteria bacterium]
MKTLYLLRHGQAIVKIPFTDLKDFDRTLTFQGKEEVEKTAKFIEENVPLPIKILCSSAKRTKETCHIIESKFSPQNYETVYHDSFYHASQQEYLEEIKKTENNYDNLLLIGHNPTLTQFLFSLTKKEDQNWSILSTFHTMPTAGLGILKFHITKWENIIFNLGLLINIIDPHKLQ